MAKSIAFLVLLLISPAAYAVTHTVGGSGGWTSSGNYATWASGRTFTTGDTLVFNYDFSHAVDEVSQADYQSCNTGNPISSDSSSPTTISLTTPGTRYFICPRSSHCSEGQRLAVNVTAGSTTPGGSPPPAGGGTTPSPPSETPETPATPGTPATPTPPTPAGGSGAASILGGRSSLMVGLSIVLAAMFGLMG